MTQAVTVQQDRWYPAPPPELDGEDDSTYTNRLLGVYGDDQRPYNHRRNRQCSIGYHTECSDWSGAECKCPCHEELMVLTGLAVNNVLRPAVLAKFPDNVLRSAAGTIARLYDLPDLTGLRVMAVAAHRFTTDSKCLLEPVPSGTATTLVQGDIELAYGSRISVVFAHDVIAILADTAAGVSGHGKAK